MACGRCNLSGINAEPISAKFREIYEAVEAISPCNFIALRDSLNDRRLQIAISFVISHP